MFFKEPVQTVLLFGSKIWVLTPPRGRSLGISAQGRVMDHREASEEIGGGGMVVFIADGNYGGGGI